MRHRGDHQAANGIASREPQVEQVDVSFPDGGRVLLVADEPIVPSPAPNSSSRWDAVCSRRHMVSRPLRRMTASEISRVVSDLILPEMSAPNLLREPRKRDSEIKMVIASGYPPSDESEGQMA